MFEDSSKLFLTAMTCLLNLRHRINHFHQVYTQNKLIDLLVCFVCRKSLLKGYLQVVLKMTEKRDPPLGSFRLNPLNTAKLTGTSVKLLQNKKTHDISFEENMDADDSQVHLGATKLHSAATEMAGPNSDISVLPTTDTKMVKSTESGVIMKMVISGPPAQAKRQKVLPESLLQRVTDIVRQQTVTTAAFGKENVPSSIEMEISENRAVYTQEKQNLVEGLKEQHCSIGDEELVQELSTSQSDVGTCDSCTVKLESSNTVITNICHKNELVGVYDKFVHNSSSSSFPTDKSDSSLDKILERKADMDMNIDKIETVSVVTEICGQPCPDNHYKGLTEHEEKEKIIASETEIDPFKNFILDEVIRNELEKKTESSMYDPETDPFGALFLDEQNNDEVMIHDTKEVDEIYNIAPLFTGELEKWRKRELKKEKKKAFKRKKGSKSAKNQSSENIEEGSGENDKEKKKKESKPVPNYFVAIQITNPKIHTGIQQVQEDVVMGNSKLKPALNKLATLHLTMFVVHLKTDDDMSRAKIAMDHCKKRLEPLYRNQQLVLDVSGLGNFRNNIVFAKIQKEDQVTKLQEIADIVEDCFLDQEIVSSEKSGSFKPHITVMKLTRDKSFRKKGGIKKIEESLYKEHVKAEFGKQFVNALQLCAMLKKKAESGYYQVEHSIQFGPDINIGLQDTLVKDNKTMNDIVSVLTNADMSENTIGMAVDDVTAAERYAEHNTLESENTDSGQKACKKPLHIKGENSELTKPAADCMTINSLQVSKVEAENSVNRGNMTETLGDEKKLNNSSKCETLDMLDKGVLFKGTDIVETTSSSMKPKGTNNHKGEIKQDLFDFKNITENIDSKSTEKEVSKKLDFMVTSNGTKNSFAESTEKDLENYGTESKYGESDNTDLIDKPLMLNSGPTNTDVDEENVQVDILHDNLHEKHSELALKPSINMFLVSKLSEDGFKEGKKGFKIYKSDENLSPKVNLPQTNTDEEMSNQDLETDNFNLFQESFVALEVRETDVSNVSTRLEDSGIDSENNITFEDKNIALDSTFKSDFEEKTNNEKINKAEDPNKPSSHPSGVRS